MNGCDNEVVKLFVCWNVRPGISLVGGHPCGQAHRALIDAGYEPEVVHAKGSRMLPSFVGRSDARKEVRRLSPDDSEDVPALVTDSGEFIQGSEQIIAWAQQTPA